jgi:hypothetical protein
MGVLKGILDNLKKLLFKKCTNPNFKRYNLQQNEQFKNTKSIRSQNIVD